MGTQQKKDDEMVTHCKFFVRLLPQFRAEVPLKFATIAQSFAIYINLAVLGN
jgi:hypothetical protein